MRNPLIPGGIDAADGPQIPPDSLCSRVGIAEDFSLIPFSPASPWLEVGVAELPEEEAHFVGELDVVLGAG